MTARTLVLAHRGGALEAPENSMESFVRAIRLGYHGVEIDVRSSRDGVLLVIHDEAVSTAAGGPPRRVAEASALDLAAFPRLDEVLGLPWGDLTLMVEVKPTPRDLELGALVAERVVARGPRNSVLASFSAAVLRAARERAPALALLALVDAETDESSFEGLALFGFGVDWKLVTPARVKGWKAGGRKLWAWTINDLERVAPVLAMGVDGVITDVPGAVLKRFG